VPEPPETDVAKIRKYCDTRVPARIRHQVRVEAAVCGNSVTIFDCRPPWHPNLTKWSKVRVAQLRYSAKTHYWGLYWADRNGVHTGPSLTAEQDQLHVWVRGMSTARRCAPQLLLALR
jgi:hypothetical protein